MSQCTWMSNGDQCQFPGTMADATTGTDRWFCAYHMRSPGMADGHEIVERSKRWAALKNPAEAWVAARRKQVYGSGDNPMVARLRAQLADREAGRTVGIASSRLLPRELGEDREAA